MHTTLKVARQLSRFPIQTTTPKGSDMYKIKHTLAALLVLVVAFVALTVASAASADPNSIPTPTPVPGQPSCAGLDTASFAQDWKNFSFEPSGVGRLTRFYGGTPTDFTQSGRYDDCAP